MERITLEELATAVDGVCPTPFVRGAAFDRVCLDPRDVSPGDLFWSISTEPDICREQLAIAEARGAVAAVVAGQDATPQPGRILVPDPRLALARFARWYRSLLDAFTIGITGCRGKAVTPRLGGAARGGPAENQNRPDHFDSMMELSLTLLHIAAHERFAVVELKATSRETLARLLDIARPEAVIITRGHGLGPELTWEKLLEVLPRGGFAVLPGDQAFPCGLSGQAHGRTWSMGHGTENTHCVCIERKETSAGRVAHEARRAGMDARPLAEFFQQESASGRWGNLVQPGDVIVIKGPQSAGLDRLVADLTPAATTRITTMPRAA